MNELRAAVIPSLSLIVDGRTYTVEFPLSSVIVAEEKVGHSLKSVTDWFHMQTKDIPEVLRAGLLKHHPEVTEAEVQAICDTLNPEALDEVQYALCKLAFPRIMAHLEESKAKGISPNVPSGAAL